MEIKSAKTHGPTGTETPLDISARIDAIRNSHTQLIQLLSDKAAYIPLDEFLAGEISDSANEVVVVKITDIHERCHEHYRPGLERDASSYDRGCVPSEPHRTDDRVIWTAQRVIGVQSFQNESNEELCAVLGCDIAIRQALDLGSVHSAANNIPETWSGTKNRGFYQKDREKWESSSFVVIRDGALLSDVIALSQGFSEIDSMVRTHEVYSSYRDEPDAAIPLPAIVVPSNLYETDSHGLAERIHNRVTKLFSPASFEMTEYLRAVLSRVHYFPGEEPPISFDDGRNESRSYSNRRSNAEKSPIPTRGLSREAQEFGERHGSHALDRELLDAHFGRGDLVGRTGNVFSDDPFFNPWAPGGTFDRGGRKRR